MDGRRLLGGEILDGGQALGHPGAGVEESGRFAKRREIERDDLAVQLAQAFDGKAVEAFALRIAAEIERRRWNADTQAPRHRLERERARGLAGKTVGRVIASGDGENARSVRC